MRKAFVFLMVLQVYDGPDVNHPTLFALCGHELPKPIESSSNFMLIELDSQISGINGRFLLDWKEIEKIPGRVQLKPLTSNGTVRIKCYSTGLMFYDFSMW